MTLNMAGFRRRPRIPAPGHLWASMWMLTILTGAPAWRLTAPRRSARSVLSISIAFRCPSRRRSAQVGTIRDKVHFNGRIGCCPPVDDAQVGILASASEATAEILGQCDGFHARPLFDNALQGLLKVVETVTLGVTKILQHLVTGWPRIELGVEVDDCHQGLVRSRMICRAGKADFDRAGPGQPNTTGRCSIYTERAAPWASVAYRLCQACNIRIDQAIDLMADEPNVFVFPQPRVKDALLVSTLNYGTVRTTRCLGNWRGEHVGHPSSLRRSVRLAYNVNLAVGAIKTERFSE